ncbi:MAG: TRAP transporter large permease [Firmicutes bacterium]|jgi:TRAP-type C4-dicarboxylate transport system permease large subunit|nr:TRAP transporter large permease [Bacillota bacterium]
MWTHYAIITLAMGIAFYVGFSRKLPVGLVMVIAGAVGLLASGNWLPIRHMVEGSFYFLNLMMIIAMSVVFVTALEMSGGFDALTRLLILRLHRVPGILLCLLMLLVMLPAMLTGSAPVAVLSTGVLVAPILLRLGIPKVQTAGILAMGGLLGQSAPPINVMIMIIATSVFMPYEGFDLPLAVLCFPMAVFSVLYLGRKYVKRETLDTIVAELKEEGSEKGSPSGLVPFIPLIVLAVLMFGPRIWPTKFVDPGSPLSFAVAAAVALFTGKKVDLIELSKRSMKKSLGVLGLFVGIGVLVQVLSFTGLRGFIAVASMAVPKSLLYPYVGITAPLLCGPLVPFGASAVVGPPFVLAFTNQNSIIIASAVSMFLSLGCLVPPTALSGLFGARVVGIEKEYGKVFRAVLVPAILTFIEALVFMIYANPIGKFFGV